MNNTSKHIAVLAGWIAITVATHLPAAEPKPGSPLFRFGAVADCQYCSQTSLLRKYNLSPKKLTECVEQYNKLDLAFVVHLGDFIARDFESFKVVTPIFAKLKAPHFHVLGNHDFSVVDEKKELVPAVRTDDTAEELKKELVLAVRTDDMAKDLKKEQVVVVPLLNRIGIEPILLRN